MYSYSVTKTKRENNLAADYDKKYNARNALRNRSRVNLKVRSRSNGARISLERESRNGKFSLNGEGRGKNSMFSFLGDYIAEGDCIDRRLQESLTIVA